MASDSNTTNYWLATSSAIVEISEVRLYQETWQDHILSNHPEVSSIGHEGIIDGLENPFRIHVSTTRPEDSFVYVSKSATSEGASLHIPVKHVEESSGRVVTAYFSRKDYKGPLLWESDDD